MLLMTTQGREGTSLSWKQESETGPFHLLNGGITWHWSRIKSIVIWDPSAEHHSDKTSGIRHPSVSMPVSDAK